MSAALFVPVVLGVVAVLQAVLNRQIAREWGLGPAALLNTLGALVLSVAFVVFCAVRGFRDGLYRVDFDFALFRVWWLLPGLFGFLLVAGLPWAVQRLGALPVFVVVVASQMVTGALWDRFVEGAPLSWPKALGALLAVASVLLVNLE
jgi:transporter family-2 protein